MYRTTRHFIVVALHGEVVTVIVSTVTISTRSLLPRSEAFTEPGTTTPKSVDGVSKSSSGIPLARYSFHKYDQHPCAICVFTFILHDLHSF